jgi:hypothetical protein
MSDHRAFSVAVNAGWFTESRDTRRLNLKNNQKGNQKGRQAERIFDIGRTA